MTTCMPPVTAKLASCRLLVFGIDNNCSINCSHWRNSITMVVAIAAVIIIAAATTFILHKKGQWINYSDHISVLAMVIHVYYQQKVLDIKVFKFSWFMDNFQSSLISFKMNDRISNYTSSLMGLSKSLLNRKPSTISSNAWCSFNFTLNKNQNKTDTKINQTIRIRNKKSRFRIMHPLC